MTEYYTPLHSLRSRTPTLAKVSLSTQGQHFDGNAKGGRTVTPIEALWETIGHAYLFDGRYRAPGTIVQRMGEKTREALQRLTSEDTRTGMMWLPEHITPHRHKIPLVGTKGQQFIYL